MSISGENPDAERRDGCQQQLDPQQQREVEQQHYARKDFNKLRDAEYVERNDHPKCDGEMLVEATTQAVR